MTDVGKGVLVAMAILCIAVGLHEGIDLNRVGTGVFVIALGAALLIIFAYEADA